MPYKDALKRIKGKCAKALGGKKAIDKLFQKGNNPFQYANFGTPIRGINPSLGVEGDIQQGAAAAVDANTKQIGVNIYGQFFADDSGKLVGANGKNYTLGNPRGFFTNIKTDSFLFKGSAFQSLVLLHEIGHLTGVFGPDNPNVVGKDKAQENSATFNDKVLKNCFKLSSVKGRDSDFVTTEVQ